MDATTPVRGPTRRDLIRAGVAIPAIFGLGALLGCTNRREHARGSTEPDPLPLARDPAGVPSWWPEYLARVKRGHRVGVVMQIPKDARARHALGTMLVDFVDRGTIDERLLFLGSVVACLSEAQLRAKFPAAAPTEGLVLVDADARRIAGAPLPEGRAATRAALENLVYGADGSRLEERAKAARAALPAATLAAFDRLETDNDRYLVSSEVLLLAPLIASERRGTPSPSRRAAIDRVLDETVSRAFSDLHPLGNLPLGIESSSQGGGCGGGDSMVACGMAMPTPGSFRFVGFLVDKSA